MNNLLMLFHVTAAKRYENHVMRLRTIQTQYFIVVLVLISGNSAIILCHRQMSKQPEWRRFHYN